MRVVFMGTPDFAVPTLQRLIESKHEVCAVFCQPDKPKGRGHKLQPPPVKTVALENNIDVYQPITLRNDEAIKLIENLSPDAIIVVAYGKILPKAVLDIPKYGCINVHGSILPKYRGAAPIQRAVLNGEEKTGVTIMHMAEGIDTGDIIQIKETAIGSDETSGELFDRLKEIGAELLVGTLTLIENGKAQRIPQNEEESTHAAMLQKSEAEISWDSSAEDIHNLVRGMNPWPVAYTTFRDENLKIYMTEPVEKQGEAGKLFSANGELFVYCGKDALKLLEIHPENKKRMNGKSFLLGRALQENESLG
jgi:methionyl-tRNA formyltransferase